jgi:hypothetical protein
VEPTGNQNPETRRIDWLGIFRILLVQVLVLLALSAAFIRYLDWSSDQAWAEFSRAVVQAPAPKAQPPSATPVQPVKDKTSCTRRV